MTGHWHRATVFVLLLLLASPIALADPAPPPIPAPSAIAAEIRSLIESAASSGVAGEPVLVDDLRRVYEALDHAPLWHLDAEAEEYGRQVEARLRAVGDHAIDADDLHPAALERTRSPGDAQVVAERDVLLTDALLRYAVKLHQGSVPADAFGPDWAIEPDSFMPANGLLLAIRDRAVPSWLDTLAPADPQYRGLLAALGQYRAIAASGGWPLVPGGAELKLDGNDPRLPVLRERLRAEGDLAGDEQGDGQAKNGPDRSALAAALRRFQARHGLEPDGRVGAGTLAALGIGAEQRVAQIAANLERWRRLPRRSDDVYVEVNVAGATLALIESKQVSLSTRVIVGDTGHPTPVVAANITAITLNPVWNVPWSIATREILPRLRRDPGYLAANDIAIVDRAEDPFGQLMDWHAVSASGFPFRLRQGPGKKNSLGRIKLEMPNSFDVYLHDTPGKALFRRGGRAFSHGCVRVEQVAALALRLLQQPDWDQARIDQEVAQGETRRRMLDRAVPVYLLYWTALVDDAGQVNFRPDLYGRDAPLAQALGLDRTQPRPATAQAWQPKG